MSKAIIIALVLSASSAAAQDVITYTTSDSFDDVVFSLENAIIDQGLLAEDVSHVGEMLKRTGKDVGSGKKVFEHAQVFSFCSAALSRKVMEADPMNIMFCPYDVFVAQLPDSDKVIVGYRSFPDGPMQEVQEMVDDIAKSAAGLE